MKSPKTNKDGRSSSTTTFVQKKGKGSFLSPARPSLRGNFRRATVIQPKLANSSNPAPIQRKCNQCEEEMPLQRKTNSTGLPVNVQAKMENSFGHDFSNVNIHKNSQSAVDMGALAYTQGNEVHFAPGQFNPSTTNGQELIGHEIAHVVQQREGRVKPTIVLRKGIFVNNETRLEREANDLGRKAAQGEDFQGNLQNRMIYSPANRFLHTKSAVIQKEDNKQNVERRITGVAASVSWIHPNSPAGDFVSDATPPNRISRNFLNARNFRFSNHVGITVTSPDAQNITSIEHDDLQMIAGRSMGIPSIVLPTERINGRGSINGIEFASAIQFVGARTQAHEVIANIAGAVVGTILIGPLGIPIGQRVGKMTSNSIVNFPPIWTMVGIAVFANGRIERIMRQRSLFPCIHFYGINDYEGGQAFLALAPEQREWESNGWGGGNPWRVARPKRLF